MKSQKKIAGPSVPSPETGGFLVASFNSLLILVGKWFSRVPIPGLLRCLANFPGAFLENLRAGSWWRLGLGTRRVLLRTSCVPSCGPWLAPRRQPCSRVSLGRRRAAALRATLRCVAPRPIFAYPLPAASCVPAGCPEPLSRLTAWAGLCLFVFLFFPSCFSMARPSPWRLTLYVTPVLAWGPLLVGGPATTREYVHFILGHLSWVRRPCDDRCHKRHASTFQDRFWDQFL